MATSIIDIVLGSLLLFNVLLLVALYRASHVLNLRAKELRQWESEIEKRDSRLTSDETHFRLQKRDWTRRRAQRMKHQSKKHGLF